MSSQSSRLKKLNGNKLSRRARIQYYGIDCVSELTWKNWTIGGEYKKKIVLKNFHEKVQTLLYQLPKTKYFYIDFPVPIKLSPGVSKSIEISFRPIEYNNYKDNVKIFVWNAINEDEKKEFTVSVKAVLPKLKYQIPQKVDFEYCPIRKITSRKIFLYNSGEINFDFKWKFESPFIISPQQGSLNSQKKMELTIEFTPPKAGTFLSKAVCFLKKGLKDNNKEYDLFFYLKISGVGKYIFLDINDKQRYENNNVQFLPTMVNSKKVLEIPLKNKSLVTGDFKIKPLDSKKDEGKRAFEFFPKSGIIEPGDTLLLKVKYSPTLPNVLNLNRFLISSTPPISANKIYVNCKGFSVGPEVEIDNISFNFGDIQIGNKKGRKKMLKLLYYNDISFNEGVEYSIVNNERNGFFRIKGELHGRIYPESTLEIPVYFYPQHPVNYYKRIYIIIKNQNYVLYVDLFGSGFDGVNSKRPKPFNIKDILKYKKRCHYGFKLYTPQQIENILSYNHTDEEDIKIKEKLSECYHDFKPEFEEKTEVMDDFFEIKKYVETESDYITFGNCPIFSENVGYKIVKIKNNSTSKITIISKSPTKQFVVFPQSQDCPGKGEVQFKVGFRPLKENEIYFSKLEFLCYFKTQRTFRLVMEQKENFVPPHIITVNCFGKTYLERFNLSPKYVFSPNKILHFPSLLINDVAYRTLMIANNGETDFSFKILDDSSELNFEKIFEFKPTSGFLKKQSHLLIVLKFNPKDEKIYNKKIKFILNENMKNVVPFQLCGVGCKPKIILENEGQLFFKPTFISNTFTRLFKVRNPTRIKINYEVVIPPKYKDIINCENNNGFLLANEEKDFKFTFSPKKIKRYLIKLKILAKSKKIHSEKIITVVGEGIRISEGIKLNLKELNFGNIEVSKKIRKPIEILNSNNCVIKYKLLFLNQKKNEKNEKVFYCKQHEGTVNPRSIKKIYIFFCPKNIVEYNFCLFCFLYKNNQEEINGEECVSVLKEKYNFCTLSGFGAHTTLKITDVKCDQFSKPQLLKMLRINRINEELGKFIPPKIRNEKEKKLINFNDYIQSFKSIKFDFGSSPLNSSPVVLFVKLQNVGSIPVSFHFYFQNEKIKEISGIKKWAENDSLKTEKEEKQENVILNKIFQISPKRGLKIKPGEFKTITMIYQNLQVMKDVKVPLLLKIENGNNLIFNLCGKTYPNKQSFLYFTSKKHNFADIQVGCKQPRIQYYELFNRSNKDVLYQFDNSCFKKIEKENYGFKILKLENPRGVIEQNGKKILRFIFNPLETKLYEMNLKVTIKDTNVEKDEKGKEKLYRLIFTGKGIEKTSDDDDINKKFKMVEKKEDPTFEISTLPCVIGELCFISMNLVNFSTLPCLSVNKKFVVLRNISKTNKVGFRWKYDDFPNDNQNLSSTFEVVPKDGVIDVNETQICCLILKAGSNPQLLETDVNIVVWNESKKIIKEIKKRRCLEKLSKVGDNESQYDEPNENLSTLKRIKKKKKTKFIPIAERGIQSKTTILPSINMKKSAFSTVDAVSIKKIVDNLYQEEEDEYGFKSLKFQNKIISIKANIMPIDSFNTSELKLSYIPKMNELKKKIFVDKMKKIEEEEEKNNEKNNEKLKKKLKKSKSVKRQFLNDFLSDLVQEVCQFQEVKDSLVDFNNVKTPFFCEFSTKNLDENLSEKKKIKKVLIQDDEVLGDDEDDDEENIGEEEIEEEEDDDEDIEINMKKSKEEETQKEEIKIEEKDQNIKEEEEKEGEDKKEEEDEKEEEDGKKEEEEKEKINENEEEIEIEEKEKPEIQKDEDDEKEKEKEKIEEYEKSMNEEEEEEGEKEVKTIENEEKEKQKIENYKIQIDEIEEEKEEEKEEYEKELTKNEKINYLVKENNLNSNISWILGETVFNIISEIVHEEVDIMNEIEEMESEEDLK